MVIGGGIVILLGFGAPPERIHFTQETFKVWVSNYSKTQEHNRIPFALSYFSKSEMLMNPLFENIMAYFFAEILRDHPDIVTQIYFHLTQTSIENGKRFFIQVLWILNNVEANELLEKIRNNWYSSEVVFNYEDVVYRQNEQDIAISYKNEPDYHNLPLLAKYWGRYLASGAETELYDLLSYFDSNIIGDAVDKPYYQYNQVEIEYMQYILLQFVVHDPKKYDQCKKSFIAYNPLTKTIMNDIKGYVNK